MSSRKPPGAFGRARLSRGRPVPLLLHLLAFATTILIRPSRHLVAISSSLAQLLIGDNVVVVNEAKANTVSRGRSR